MLDFGMFFPAWFAVNELFAGMDQFGAGCRGACGRRVGADARIVPPAVLLSGLPGCGGAPVLSAVPLLVVARGQAAGSPLVLLLVRLVLLERDLRSCIGAEPVGPV